MARTHTYIPLLPLLKAFHFSSIALPNVTHFAALFCHSHANSCTPRILRISIYPYAFWASSIRPLQICFTRNRILRSCLDFHSFILLIFYALPFYLLAYIFTVEMRDSPTFHSNNPCPNTSHRQQVN